MDEFRGLDNNSTLGKGFTTIKRRVKTLPIFEINEIQNEIDLFMIDVEGHEFSVLESINWEVHSPEVFLIENCGTFYPRSKLINYMSLKGYDFIARIGTVDDIFVRKAQNRQ